MLPKSGRPLGPGGKGGFWGLSLYFMMRKDSDAKMAVTRTREVDMLKDEARSLRYGVLSYMGATWYLIFARVKDSLYNLLG